MDEPRVNVVSIVTIWDLQNAPLIMIQIDQLKKQI